jgi:prepilin-type N-terminal cleavage/methylation domain-containing protein
LTMEKSKDIIKHYMKGGESIAGFTLLELMIVIIIVGILATLGIMSYQAAVEKSRGAEARKVISALRSMCAAFYLEDHDLSKCTLDNLAISNIASAVPIPGKLPGFQCWPTHFFIYGISNLVMPSQVTFAATRCAAGGKTPDLTSGAGSVSLAVDFSDGADKWDTVGGY